MGQVTRFERFADRDPSDVRSAVENALEQPITKFVDAEIVAANDVVTRRIVIETPVPMEGDT